MAVSTTTTNSQGYFADKMKQKYGFDSFSIRNDPMSLMIELRAYYGGQVYTQMVDSRLIEQMGQTSYLDLLEGVVMGMAKSLGINRRSSMTVSFTNGPAVSVSPPRDWLDLRHNAIESSDDVAALIHRRRGDGQRVNTIMVAPDQVNALRISRDYHVSADTRKSDQIFGVNVVVERLDA